MTKPAKKYSDMQSQLDAAMNKLESGELEIDDAIEQYKNVQKLIEQMEEYLKTAKNKITHMGNGVRGT